MINIKDLLNTVLAQEPNVFPEVCLIFLTVDIHNDFPNAFLEKQYQEGVEMTIWLLSGTK